MLAQDRGAAVVTTMSNVVTFEQDEVAPHHDDIDVTMDTIEFVTDVRFYTAIGRSSSAIDAYCI